MQDSRLSVLFTTQLPAPDCFVFLVKAIMGFLKSGHGNV